MQLSREVLGEEKKDRGNVVKKGLNGFHFCFSSKEAPNNYRLVNVQLFISMIKAHQAIEPYFLHGPRTFPYLKR